jgi:prepilin-type N-terminal cleavage/methylation domain-containing protein
MSMVKCQMSNVKNCLSMVKCQMSNVKNCLSMVKCQMSNVKYKLGFSLIEVLLASTILLLLATAVIAGVIYGQQSTAGAGSRARAVLLAEEGIEAARSIRNSDFADLTAGTHGLAVVSNEWTLSGSSDTTDSRFTRTLEITDSGSDRKELVCAVTWQQNPQKQDTVTMSSQITNWGGGAGAPQTCALYCQSLLIYTTGTCRVNAQACTNNSETHESGGDEFCTGGGGSDTCCCKP